MLDRKRVVITGMGAITPLGKSVGEFWEGLVSGRSGIGPITLCDPSPYPCQIAGEVPNFDPGEYINPKEARRLARFSQLSIAASTMAVKDANLDLEKEDLSMMGVLLGNGAGGLDTTQIACLDMQEKGAMKINPFFIPMMLPNMAAANVARVFGAKGYNSTVITACAASNQAIGEALEVIRRGAADVVLAGGVEASISEIGLSGFCILRALTNSNEEPQKASRPFDAGRDGFVPAEGSAIVVLESFDHAIKRGAPILAELIGYGSSCDAFHAVQPDDTGEGAARAIRWALRDAAIDVNQVDYINAHGTSTPMNDKLETQAIHSILGELSTKIPVSSTKSMTGHLLGAGGALEAIICSLSIRKGILPPTINLNEVDPNCNLVHIYPKAEKRNIKIALSNSFGFGGHNSVLVFKDV